MSHTKPRKLTIVRMPTHPLRLDPGEAVHPGPSLARRGDVVRRAGGSVLEVVGVIIAKPAAAYLPKSAADQVPLSSHRHHGNTVRADRVGKADGLALFQIQVHKADLPRRRVCQH